MAFPHLLSRIGLGRGFTTFDVLIFGDYVDTFEDTDFQLVPTETREAFNRISRVIERLSGENQ